MTIREFYRNVLIELNKEEASALYVEDFLYYANKAINWYANTRYNQYDTTQQLGDDLKDLRKGPEELRKTDEGVYDLNKLKHSYRHLLNCIVHVEIHTKENTLECKAGQVIKKAYPATRLTSDRKSAILNNAYLEPKFYRPYFDIIGDKISILVGEDNTKDDFYVQKVTVEYLKNPEEITMKVDDLLVPEDNTAELEFSNYVITEILNQTVVFILEQAGDPRVSVNPAVNQSIQAFGAQTK